MDDDMRAEREGSTAPRCTAMQKDGVTPCTNFSRAGKATCYPHRPPEERGRRDHPKNERPEAVAAELAAADDAATIRAIVTRVAGLVLAGTVPPRTGQVVAALANTALRAISDDLAVELAELKALLASHESEQVRGWARRRKGGK